LAGGDGLSAAAHKFSLLSVRAHSQHSNLEFTLPKSVEKQFVNSNRCSWL